MWSEHKTEAGKVYYYNSITKQSVWERPKDMDESPPAESPKTPEPGRGATALSAPRSGETKIC